MPERIKLTTDEIRMGIRRIADSPRLKYLARAVDGRGRPLLTASVIKRAMALAEKDGIKLDPLTGDVIPGQTPTPRPAKKKAKAKAKKPAEAQEGPSKAPPRRAPSGPPPTENAPEAPESAGPTPAEPAE